MAKKIDDYLIHLCEKDNILNDFIKTIINKLGEEFVANYIHGGFMNESKFFHDYNELRLNLEKYNEEIILKIKNAINANSWYIIFDGWAEDMYIIYTFNKQIT